MKKKMKVSAQYLRHVTIYLLKQVIIKNEKF